MDGRESGAEAEMRSLRLLQWSRRGVGAGEGRRGGDRANRGDGGHVLGIQSTGQADGFSVEGGKK